MGKADSVLRIVGAGPAGLAAAIAARRVGRPVVVYERGPSVGSRFHGDYQGLENWSTEGDVLDEIRGLGIAVDFDTFPFHEQVCFGPDGRDYRVRTADRPFYYVVRRGPEPGTLDRALEAQALAAGVEIRFGQPVRELLPGDVVAWGPRRADILAVGYLFETDLPDGGYAVLNDRLAPAGYGYLLVAAGRATLSTCLFSRFENASAYLAATLDFFQRKLGFSMRNPQRFGGAGSAFVASPILPGPLFPIGEAAGVQDFLWGFGIRYALRSGTLAATDGAATPARAYRRLWEEAIGRRLRTGFVNRRLYSAAGGLVYGWLLKKLSQSRDPRAFLRRLYAPAAWKRALFPLLHPLAGARRVRAAGGL
jgi:flavin-dependent dehydrogenase